MISILKNIVQLALLGMAMLSGALSQAATNQVTDPGGGTVSLISSGNVTVNSSTLQLVKQVYDTTGNCLASSPADVNCNAGASTVTVPAGTNLKFMIFFRNATEVSVPDVRFQDVLDVTATGFTYGVGTIKYSNSQVDTATIAQIYAATDAGTAQTDAVGAPDDVASYASGTLTVGAVTAQANQALNVAANKVFAIIFSATKK